MTGRPRIAVQAAIATIATATALSAVFSGLGWLGPVVGGVLIVAAVNEATRRSPVAAAVGPLLAAAGVLVYLTAIEAGDTAYGRVIPTGASLRALGNLARGGFDDIRVLTTPVPTHQGLVMLAVIGVAAVALVVDLLAVTLRRAAAAGLPLLAVFAVCTSVARHGVGWVPFALATAGYLWLLLADAQERVGRWGQTLGSTGSSRARVTWADTDAAPSPLSALGRRIGATAIAVGVVVPMLLPGLHGGLPKHGGGSGGSGSGSNQVVTVNPIVTIRSQLTSAKAIPVLAMTSTDTSPVYLRMTSLDRFDGATFSPSVLVAPAQARVRNGIDAPALPGTPVRTRVSVAGLDVHWLPVPTQVESVAAKGDWRYDASSNTVFSARADTRRLTYSTTSVRNEPPAAALDAAPPPQPAEFARYLEVPGSVSDAVRALATSVTAKAVSPFRKAVAIQNYLTSPPFAYDTDVPASDSSDSLAQFLLVTKRGFCQQYAASMAIMARIVGIPSRVAVGFTRGTQQPDGTWLVTTHDAHAWPELYFPGFGWLPFEPTPRSDGQTVTPAFTRAAAHSAPASDLTDLPRPSPTSAAGASLANRKDAGSDPPVAAVHPVGRHQGSHLRWLLLAALVALALPTPGLARALSRRRRWWAASDARGQAHAAWAELRASAIDAGVAWADGLTPRASARLLAAHAGLDGAARETLDRLVAAEERARYAPIPTEAGAGAEAGREGFAALRSDVAAVAQAMMAGAPPWRRLTALAWPRSTLRAVRGLGDRVADALDQLDMAGVRLRRWWRRRSAATLS